MAPNRKQVTTLLPSPTDLANLQNTLQPKFLPLTHPNEEQQHVQRQTQHDEPINTANSAEPIASYWDWPADIPVQETKKDLFSVAHLESNLIQAANTIPVVAESSTVAANDEYWAEESCIRTECEPAVTKPQHLIASSYWDWGTAITPKEKNHATIQKIIQEDKAHRIVSASLQVQKPAPTTVTSNSNTLQKSHDEYWCWESPVTASRVLDVNHPWANYWDEKQEPNTTTMIQHIKDYEHARQVLTVAHMVQILMQHHPVPSTCSSAINNVSSDNYWSWSEPLGDVYWDTTTTAAIPVVTCGGCVDYWDM